MADHETTPSRCPRCGYEVTGASNARENDDRPGDLSVCLDCGEVLVFDDDLTVTIATHAELAALDRDTRRILQLTSLYARELRRKRGGRSLESSRST